MPWPEVYSMPQVWGFSEVWTEYDRGVQPGDPTMIVGRTVPKGVVWVLTFAAAANSTRGITYCGLYLWDGAVYMTLAFELSRARYQPVVFNGFVPLVEGNWIMAQLPGSLDGDVVELCIRGYKMLLPSPTP